MSIIVVIIAGNKDILSVVYSNWNNDGFKLEIPFIKMCETIEKRIPNVINADNFTVSLRNLLNY